MKPVEITVVSGRNADTCGMRGMACGNTAYAIPSRAVTRFVSIVHDEWPDSLEDAIREPMEA